MLLMSEIALFIRHHDEDIGMYNQKISTRHILFWTLAIALLSSISTVIFSETLINDSLGILTIVMSSLGLFAYGSLRLLDSVNDICNP